MWRPLRADGDMPARQVRLVDRGTADIVRHDRISRSAACESRTVAIRSCPINAALGGLLRLTVLASFEGFGRRRRDLRHKPSPVKVSGPDDFAAAGRFRNSICAGESFWLLWLPDHPVPAIVNYKSY
jgi:hypothetical protein